MSNLPSLLCPVLYLANGEPYYPCSLENIDDTVIINSLIANPPMYYFHDLMERYITYIVFYQQDGGIHNIGGHKYDIEFTRVFYDSNNKPIKYYLSENGRDQGMYLDADRVRHDENGRPIFFIAIRTHAHYPASGTWVRGFCFANDQTSGHQKWDPVNNLVEISDPNTIGNRFGAGHMQWYAAPCDIIGAPSEPFNFIYRFFYPVSRWIRFKKFS